MFKLFNPFSNKNNSRKPIIIKNPFPEHMLPEDANAKLVITEYLYGQYGSTGNALEALFSQNAAGIEFKSVHSNFLPIVKFTKRESEFCNTRLTGDEMELHHLYSQLESIVEILDKQEKSCIDKKKREECLKQLELGQNLLQVVRDEPEKMKLPCYYNLIIHNWSVLDNWSRTYRLLSDLVSLESNWRDNAEIRLELGELICNLANEWHNESKNPTFNYKDTAASNTIINFTYKPGSLIDGVDLYANNAFIGELSSLCEPDVLLWSAVSDTQVVELALKNGAYFDKIVAEIEKYRLKNGYERLCISNNYGGIASFFPAEFLLFHGFSVSEDGPASLYFYKK